MRRSKRLVALARLETRRAGPAAAAAVAGVKTAKAPPPVLLYPLSSNALFGKLALSWTFLWCLWSWPAGQWWKNDDCWLHLGGANSTIYRRHDSQPPTHAQLFSKTFQMTIIYMVWNEKKTERCITLKWASDSLVHPFSLWEHIFWQKSVSRS